MNAIKKLMQAIGLSTLICATTSAQPLTELDIHSIPENLNTYLKQANDGWFGYSIPAAKNTRSMCCFINRGKQAVCNLNKTQSGFGTFGDSPFTDNIHIFVNLKQGQVNQIMPVGDHCEVNAVGTTVDWLADVSEQQSIQWLTKQVLAFQQGDRNGGLYVLSLHQNEAAAEALYDLADNNAGDYSEQAVFWLGERQQDGFKYLKSLYEDLPQGEVRRKLNFALSQNKNKEALKLLKSIAQHDQDNVQQADAIFWLSQTDELADLPAFLIELMNTSNNHEVKEKAIFSLSQINTDEAKSELMKLVKDHKDAEVREKALFWLAQNSPQKAKKAALEVLKSDHQENEQENAVFVLSQLGSKESSAVLFEIVKGDYSRNIKKKALFWLSQSSDEGTLQQLEELL